MSDEPADVPVTAIAIDRAAIDRAFRTAAKLYVETRRTRIPYFVNRHFSLAGAIRLHRVAFGLDLLRAPVNLALALPHLLKLLIVPIMARLGARRLAGWLEVLPTQLRTDVAREVDWLMWSELLELPYREGDRATDRDALGETLLARPEVVRALTAAEEIVAQNRSDARFNEGLAENLARYTGARIAAAEITTALTAAGAGGLMVQQLTPTAFTLGPALATLLANHAAILAFPLGTGLGGLWYAAFPADPGWEMIAAVTGGLMVLSSVFAAFAGVVADPVQKMLGVHRRQLNRLVDAIEADLTGKGRGGFAVRTHYVARLFDFFDAVRIALRAAA